MVAEIVVMTAMHRSRSFLGRLAGATLAAVIVGATAASAQDADQQAPKKQITPTVMKTFGGWDVRCYPVSTPAPCDMWEAIAFKKGGQLAVSVSIVYVPSRDDHLLQFIVPLGVDLAKGAKIVSPSYSSDTWPYHHCDRIGCYIVVPGGNGVVEALKGLTAMNVRVTQFHGKSIDLSVPLNGFSDAHASMVEFARQKTAGKSPAPPPASTTP